MGISTLDTSDTCKAAPPDVVRCSRSEREASSRIPRRYVRRIGVASREQPAFASRLPGGGREIGSEAARNGGPDNRCKRHSPTQPNIVAHIGRLGTGPRTTDSIVTTGLMQT